MNTRPSVCLTAMLLLASCADTNHGNLLSSQSKEVQSVLRKDIALLNGQRRAELQQLKETVATRDDTKSWAAIARFYFENERYSKAIVYAEESLKRHPGNVEAGSIVAVSGLRVSAAAIDSLRRHRLQETGAATDERAVTEILRSTLKEEALVPPEARPN